MKRVCIVGAGTAGLAAARRALENNFAVTVYEQTDQVGGTWVYTDQIGTNEYGLDVHSSMYQGLRTNLPKEVMGYADFPIEGYEESYVPSQAIEHFLKDYAAKYKVDEHIHFLHYVIRITPKNNQWQVIVKNLQSERVDFLLFDHVMVCSGSYHNPVYPIIRGSETFKGRQIHSHDYKNSQAFKDETVLIIGAGPSGMDLCHEISKVAKRVTLSHHRPETYKTTFSPNVNQQTDVANIDGYNVYFVNDDHDTYSIIFYCTGFKYSYPFLSVDCGIHVDDNYVQHLYKHCINIEYPSMCFIGIPFYVCAAQLFDLQARFVMKFWSGDKEFPTKDEMLQDTRNGMEERFARGQKKRLAHFMGKDQQTYYDDLAETADIENINPVMAALNNECCRRFFDNFLHFREDVFRIKDDKRYEQIK